MLGYPHLLNVESNRGYLLEKTQHAIGGFGKNLGAPPDIYHSYTGLAALSVMGEKDLKPINATACMSVDTCKRIASLPWRKAIWDEDMI